MSITCCVYAQQQHTVFAMVLGKGGKKLPEIKVNGVKMSLHAPQGNTGAQEPGALVQGPPPGPATFVVGGKAADNKPRPPTMAAALVMPVASKPKTAQEKAMDDLKLTKEEKAKLFPCDDYQPYCKNYAATGQCRDVWTQKNCRKSCKLCDIPYGVFIGCQDLDVCKKFAASACMVRWVRETCKSKCGACGYERQGNSHITMGKKRHFTNANTKQQADKTKHVVKTKQLKKVLKKMTKKAKDAVKQAAAKVKQHKKEDKPVLIPEVAHDEKPVPKEEETHSEDNDDNNDDDDDEADDNSDEDDDTSDVSGEGSSHDEDEDDDDDDKASGEVKSEDKPDKPIRLDTDPGGEPVVAKLVNQPIKFNDAPGKAMHVKLVKDAKPKVVQKKVAKKVNNDKIEKKVKQIKKVQTEHDKPKTKGH
ncbi:hypothetical protein ACROYT_G023494 [Oculina patagonica]